MKLQIGDIIKDKTVEDSNPHKYYLVIQETDNYITALYFQDFKKEKKSEIKNQVIIGHIDIKDLFNKEFYRQTEKRYIGKDSNGIWE